MGLASDPGDPKPGMTKKIPEQKFWDLKVEQKQQKDLGVCCWSFGRGL